jgi:ClpP class serine protease
VDGGRPNLDVATVSALADGKVYAADKAVELGLVDSIGDYEDAIKRAAELARIEEPTVVTYGTSGSHGGAYTIGSPDHTSGRRVDGEGGMSFTVNLDSLPRTRFLYLWAP